MNVPLNVLLVEDSEDDATLIVRELHRGGYDVRFQRVDTPGNLSTALERSKWDLVLCDYSMPGLHGDDALTLLRESGADVPFIFVSGTIGEDIAVDALKRGAQDYVLKGNLKRLLPAVRRELLDVQERRERLRLEEQVQHLRRFEAIGRLAGGIAHDFNNALGVILGWAQLGYDEVPPDSPSRPRFQAIQEQARSSAGLVKQLLAFARKQVLQPHKLDLNELVKRSQGLLQSVMGEGIEFIVKSSPDAAVINADPGQIEQVLMNLCLNARDAMPNGGRLLLETRHTEIVSEFSNAYMHARPGRFVQLSVSDTGTGMDQATLEHVFEPFFTTKDVGKGTGLGLSTVYGIVEQHDGFVDVQSELGHGTSFDAYFPASSGVPEEIRPAASGEIQPGTETVLVAEDNPALLDLARETLTSQGYRVLVARNGGEAVRIFQAKAQEIQLVVLDVVMPVLSGPDVYEKMREMVPTLPVIFMTGHSVEVASLDLNVVKGALFLPKPYEFQDLHRAVRNALDSGKNIH